MTKNFEEGKIYLAKSSCDRIYFEVTARTAKTATFKLIGRQENVSSFDPCKIDVAGNGATQKSTIRVEDNVEYDYVKVEVKIWNVVSEERVCIEAKDEVKIRIETSEAEEQTANVETAENQTAKFEEGKTYFNIWNQEDGRPHMRHYTIVKRTPKTIVLKSGYRCRIFTNENGVEAAKVSYGTYIYASNLCTLETANRQIETDKAWNNIEAEQRRRYHEIKAAFFADKIAREVKAYDEDVPFNVMPSETDDTDDELVDPPEKADIYDDLSQKMVSILLKLRSLGREIEDVMRRLEK